MFIYEPLQNFFEGIGVIPIMRRQSVRQKMPRPLAREKVFAVAQQIKINNHQTWRGLDRAGKDPDIRNCGF